MTPDGSAAPRGTFKAMILLVLADSKISIINKTEHETFTFYVYAHLDKLGRLGECSPFAHRVAGMRG